MAPSSFDRPSAPDVLQRTAQKAYVDLIARLVVERDLRSGPLVAEGRRFQDHVSRLITGALGPPPIRVLALLIQTPICPTLDESAESDSRSPLFHPTCISARCRWRQRPRPVPGTSQCAWPRA